MDRSLIKAAVASFGTAESFLNAAGITRTRQSHQVTASGLYKFLKSAYAEFCSQVGEDIEEVLCFEDWCDGRKLDILQFPFWHLVLSMKQVIIPLIRVFQEANFELYCQALSELLPYLFANNNVHYARWLPIHLKDMFTLEEKHPRLAEEFNNGKFVVHKSSRDYWPLTKMF